MKFKFFFFLFLTLNTSFSQTKTLKPKCPKIVHNSYKEILFDKYKTVFNKDTITLNEIRYECVFTAFYTKKVMFDKFGKWNKAIYPKNRRHPILVWKNIDLFSDGKKYNIYTSGLEEWRHIYSSVMVFDQKNNDLLAFDSDERKKITSYFGDLIKNNKSSKRKFYRVYWREVKKTKKNSIFDSSDNYISEYKKKGVIENKTLFDSIISKRINKEIDSTKPIVIIYYPGKDLCNSTGSATRRTKKTWYDKIEKEIKQIKSSNILYFYKDSIGLFGRNDAFKKWYKDQDSFLENLFFKQTPICSGYVIINEKGKFITQLSEFDKKSILRDFKKIK